jgi:hypothetical protein
VAPEIFAVVIDALTVAGFFTARGRNKLDSLSLSMIFAI